MLRKLDANRFLLLVFIIAVVAYTWWEMNMGHNLEAQDKYASISSLQFPMLIIFSIQAIHDCLDFQCNDLGSHGWVE